MDVLITESVVAGRFEIEQAAGRGGMATIYRARDRVTGETVAIKLLRTDSGSLNKAERFAREAQLLSELRHRGIVSHIAHGQTLDGQFFLAMEWLDGEDLSQRLARGPLSLRDCVLLLQRVAEALSVVHQKGIIHRDLKPTNLFLVGNQIDQVKILDFGIARRLGTSRVLTRIGMLVGTPEYMAPEQARGSLELTPATDLFSLGCVLYECLTGAPPFVAEHITAVLVQVLFEEPRPIGQWRSDVPDSLLRLLTRLLAKVQTQRLADAEALRAELSALGDLPEPGSFAEVASPCALQPAFAEHEQSLFSVVLAALPVADLAQDATLQESGALLAEAERQVLVQALLALGTRPDFLADGSLIVTAPPMESAQDQAVLAAHAALRIKAYWAEAAVSMATGRGMTQGYTAVGEVVEHAARRLRNSSESSASPAANGVFVDMLSAKLLEGRFTLVAQSDGALLRAEEMTADTSRPLLGKPIPCVGRESELAILEAQLVGSIEDSEARAVLITAPPGAGKSRLRHEFLRRVSERREPPTVLLGRGDIMSAGAPYGILGQAIRRLCGLDGSEPLAVQRARLAADIGAPLAELSRSRVVGFVSELCGVAFVGDNECYIAARQDPLLLQAQIRRAFIEWLWAVSQQRPVLIVIDDLQWGDALSVELLDQALRELREAPLSMLALGRPEVRDTFPKLWAGHRLVELPLKGLRKKDCERLVRLVLGSGIPEATVSRLIEQSAGNALFLEELIRAAAEKGAVELPDTVLAMLQARIGRLERWQRRTVEAASVFGRSFWRGGVRALLGQDGNLQTLDTSLETLVQLEMIERRPHCHLPNEVEYRFRHALVRDAAYGLLSQANQELGRCLAGRYLEQAGERDPMVLAGPRPSCRL